MLNDVRDPPRLAAVAGERRMGNARLCSIWHGVVSVSDAAPGGTARECGFCSKKPAQELSIGIFPACVSRSSSRLVAESWRNHGCGSGGIRIQLKSIAAKARCPARGTTTCTQEIGRAHV